MESFDTWQFKNDQLRDGVEIMEKNFLIGALWELAEGFLNQLRWHETGTGIDLGEGLK